MPLGTGAAEFGTVEDRLAPSQCFQHRQQLGRRDQFGGDGIRRLLSIAIRCSAYGFCSAATKTFATLDGCRGWMRVPLDIGRCRPAGSPDSSYLR